MARHLKYDIPGPDRRVAFEDLRDRGVLAAFAPDLPEPAALVVELGFGRGEFLLGLAEASPTQAHVGVELSFKRSVKMARRLARRPLRNVRLVQGLAQQVVQEALPDASVACFWINFPDPWPKKRHARRRLLQPELAAWLVRRLVPGGSLRIATDDEAYAVTGYADDLVLDSPDGTRLPAGRHNFEDGNASPALAGRAAYSPAEGWEFGLSGYHGAWNGMRV